MAIKAIEICRVSRLNQGFHHPTYNPNGSKLASDGKKWYETAVSFTSISDCFSGEKLQTASGYIGTTSARPDGLFYDQVSENSITDLRNSSAKVEDYNRLIDREFNKLVAGTYRGSEGEINTKYAQFILFSCVYSNSVTSIASSTLGAENISILGNLYTDVLIKGNSGTWYKGYITSAFNVVLKGEHGNVSTDFTDNNATVYDIIYFNKSTRTKSNTLTHTDIIGSPTNYPTAWKQSGVSGTPLIVAEDGTSLLPTGSLTAFKLSKKANDTPLQVLKSTDSGATWTALTVTTHYTFSTTTNTITFVTAPASTDLIMVTYQTHTNMAVAGVNREVLGVGDVQASNFSLGLVGSYLSYSLINKIPTGLSGTRHTIWTPLIEKSLDDSSKFVANTYWYPMNSTLTLNSVVSPAVKVFPYLTRSNGKARLQLVFKEMKYNGTSWGDDNKFNIVDNVSTTTDNNAQTVLIGQKYCELPYFISAGE